MPPVTCTQGRIHSVETCGTVDGPGIRFVVFTQGCPLRCLYCHNPDCRSFTGGREVSVDELVAEIQRYRSYLRHGGVTISGGEPLLQPEFTGELIHRCRQLGIHTAVDTSGYIPLAQSRPVLEEVDLVLLDIKSFDPEIYFRITHVDLQPTLETARFLDQIQKPTWIRFVLVPGLSDPVANVEGLADFVATLSNVERVEVLPFHKMGEYKWEQLGMDYLLKDTPPPSADLIRQTAAIFRDRGLQVVGDS
ncbi:MAG: pyruvate formate lyase-activating protein [Synechococcaceae cyanobacterium SM2_3_1]|nr:pyruvate formate lyase-activating protein [Synechococcaceae cyanobacterium SM2_3_1]